MSKQIHTEARAAIASRRAMFSLLIALLALLGSSTQAFADNAAAQESPSFLNQKYLLGDWGGARTKLAEDKGISFDFFLQSDLLSNVKGGTEASGGWNRIRGTMDIDMNKLAHIKGMSLHITSTYNAGVDVGRYLGSMAAPAGNDTGLHQLRLDSFWVKQDLFNSKVSLYAGQISGFDFFGFEPADFAHFAMEPLFYAPLTLYNTYSSWDPNTTPAAMVQITPVKHFYYRTMIQAATRDNLTRNPSGTGLDIRDGTVWNNELGFLAGQGGQDAKQKHYAGDYHVGVSYTGAKFYSIQSGLPDKGNYAFYFIGKQAVWRPVAGSDKGLDLRLTLVTSPGDKGIWNASTGSVLPVYAANKQAIVTAVFNGLIPGRPKDSINFGMNYYGVRDSLKPLTSEKAYEINYSLQATPFLQIMPLVQFYQDIGANPKNGNGVVAGFRTKVNF